MWYNFGSAKFIVLKQIWQKNIERDDHDEIEW